MANQNGIQKDDSENYTQEDIEKYPYNEVSKEQRTRNNPKREHFGHFTGRCAICQSNDLWSDNLHYGCNSCGALLA